jgi:hypothetical protein
VIIVSPGGARLTDGSTLTASTQVKFAFTAGGGLKIWINEMFAVRAEAQGWALGTTPDVLLDFSRSSDRWTVPVGAFLVKTFVLPSLALQVQFGGYYNVVRPDGAPQ